MDSEIEPLFGNTNVSNSSIRTRRRISDSEETSLFLQHSDEPSEPDHGTKQYLIRHAPSSISRILYPVCICMLLSIFLNSILGDFTCHKFTKIRTYTPHSLDNYIQLQLNSSQSPHISLQSEFITAFSFVISFMTSIIVFTFLLTFLYKNQCTFLIRIWMIFTVLILFFYQFGLYFYHFILSKCILIDGISFLVIVYNISIVGTLNIFWKSPKILLQITLIFIASVLSTIFVTLFRSNNIVPWILLFALSLWDLIAVLTPFGPLKQLVDLASARSEPLPALVYDSDPVTQRTGVLNEDEVTRKEGAFDMKNERVYLKLGLGDFVFYSVLVNTSLSQGGMICAICTFVAVLLGLIITLLLLFIPKHPMPLPALPISLCMGILTHFISNHHLKSITFELFKNGVLL